MIKTIVTGFKEFWYTHMQVHFFFNNYGFFLSMFHHYCIMTSFKKEMKFGEVQTDMSNNRI